MDKVSNELVLDLVEIIYKEDHILFKEWITRNEFSEDLLQDVIGLAEVHLNSGTFVDVSDEIGDEKLFRFINHCLAIVPYLALSKDGKQKKDSDQKRSKSNTKVEKQCPKNHFKIDIVTEMIEFLKIPLPKDIGLFLTCGPHSFELKRYTTQSLMKEFEQATGISIKASTWDKWKHPVTKARRKSFQKRFQKLFS